jgi:hypothetical protein
MWCEPAEQMLPAHGWQEVGEVALDEDVELFGPTCEGLPEKAKGPLRLQGDHGPVAYRNIQIKPL